MSAGICFFISVFFSPIFASFPPWATGCVLILVGSMMAKSATYINWKYAGDAIPAFVTMVLMPFTYSIADGLIAGICTYILINTVVYVLEKVSGGRIVPQNKHEKEPWTWRIPGGFWPPWLKRLISRRETFWTKRCDSTDMGVDTANDVDKGGSIRSEAEAIRSSEGSIGISTADVISDSKHS
jgi:AGZA family xanthine/uracil permease-like MFS transporter